MHMLGFANRVLVWVFVTDDAPQLKHNFIVGLGLGLGTLDAEHIITSFRIKSDLGIDPLHKSCSTLRADLHACIRSLAIPMDMARM